MEKKCFKCNKVKSIDLFYKHPRTLDGRLNKCIECTKMDIQRNYLEKSKSEEFVEKERLRGRDKYKRLNYYDKYKEQTIVKSWLLNQKYKNLNRHFKLEKGIECHHWNYNDEFITDVFFLTRKSHKKVHKYLLLDIDNKIFKTIDGTILDTYEKHRDFIEQYAEFVIPF